MSFEKIGGMRSVGKAPFSVFLAATVVIFVLSLSAADSVGFVPYYIDGSAPSHPDSIALSDLPELGNDVPQFISDRGAPQGTGPGVEPTHIRIPAIDLDLPVSNPQTRDLEKLDEILKNGPARYVDSAKLGEKGNVLIFGHSSHLPVVHNQMYKAFNKIPDLKAGDSVIVEGGGKAYEYRVIEVKSVSIEDTDAIIDLSKSGQKLTIVTSDTLTGKSARFVMEAEFVGSYSL